VTRNSECRRLSSAAYPDVRVDGSAVITSPVIKYGVPELVKRSGAGILRDVVCIYAAVPMSAG